MKHKVTDLNDPNELVMFSTSIRGNFCFEIFFGELNVELSPNANSYMRIWTLSLNTDRWASLYISRY